MVKNDVEKSNNSLALLSLVAVVAIVGVIGLVMMTSTGGSANMPSADYVSDDANVAGEAVVGTSYKTVVRDQQWCKCVVEDYYAGGRDLVDYFAPPCNEGSDCTIDTSNGPVVGVSHETTAAVQVMDVTK
ncbi:MAG: hypothetical protein ACOCQQ_01275 [Candidatus Nanoarchaeia archaeon]